MTSDKYLMALRPFAYLFNKYWKPNPDVLVAGFTAPQFNLPDNFSFMSLGKFEDYPVDKWSDAFLKLLNRIKDEAFVLMLEDYWITRHVNSEAVHILYDYALQFEYVLKVDLCGDRLYAHGADVNYGSVSYLDLVKSMPGSPYHMSLMTGIWRRDHLLRLIIPGESPWDIELAGTTRVSHDQEAIVIGTRQWPVRHSLAFRAENPGKLKLEEIATVDIQEMRELGLLDPWEKEE
jgi:hypothetical protein